MQIFTGVSPLTPDVSCDRLLAKEMEKRDKEVQRLREQHEFELLRVRKPKVLTFLRKN